MTLYFAYGSNMNRDQMDLRCPQNMLLGEAHLPKTRLAFGGHSKTRGGGVATLCRQNKGETRGILWALSAKDLAKLDRAEGVPFQYKRVWVTVMWQGSKTRAVTYKLRNYFASEPHIDYWRIIRQTYSRNGWDTAALDRITPLMSKTPPRLSSRWFDLPESFQRNPPPRPHLDLLARPEQHKVFVYGSLRKGAHNHHVLTPATFVGTAKTASKFELLDLGSFPAMIPGSKSIHGEIWQVDEDKLAALDVFEGCPNFYRREIIQLEDGSRVQAYLYSERPKGRSVVPSGDWLTHLATRRSERTFWPSIR